MRFSVFEFGSCLATPRDPPNQDVSGFWLHFRPFVYKFHTYVSDSGVENGGIQIICLQPIECDKGWCPDTSTGRTYFAMPQVPGCTKVKAGTDSSELVRRLTSFGSGSRYISWNLCTTNAQSRTSNRSCPRKSNRLA